MRLTNPYTGLVVDAPEGVAEQLVSKGFKPAEDAAPKKAAPKRRAAKKPATKTE